MDEELHSLSRRLIELRIEHADLDAMIDRLAEQPPIDELALQRLKKRRLALRDLMARLAAALEPVRVELVTTYRNDGAIARVAAEGQGQMGGYGAVLGDQGAIQVGAWVWQQAQAGWPRSDRA